MKITVMGLGYIGLPTAITLAEAGFEVCGFDVNKKTIETLQGGHIHIVEPGLQEAFEKAVAHGHLHFSEELGKSDVFYISVPTPFFKDENGSHKADLRFVESAGRMAGKVLEPSNLVILESTVPPHISKHLHVRRPDCRQSLLLLLRTSSDHRSVLQAGSRKFPGQSFQDIQPEHYIQLS